MGKKSKGGGETTSSVQKAEPWSGVQPQLLDLYGKTQAWANGGPTTPGINWNTQHSANMTRAQALRGSPNVDQAMWTAEDISNGNNGTRNPVQTGQMLMDNHWAFGAGIKDNATAMGKYLGEGNPYLEGMVGAATRSVKDDFMQSIAPSLASQFSAAGRTGSGSHVSAFTGATSKLGERLGDMNQNIRGQQYQFERGLMDRAWEAERSRQFQQYDAERTGQRNMWMEDPRTRLAAAGMAPQLAQAKYIDSQMLGQAGLMERDIEQAQMDDPLKKLQAYSGILNGAAGYGTTSTEGSGSSTKPYNKVSGAIGGGLGGYALANMIVPGSGMIGAALGGLGGLFG